MPKSGVIEDDRIFLARRRAQHPADHLTVQAELLRRPRQDAAADLGAIPTFGQHRAVRHHLRLAATEPCEDGLSLGEWGAAVEMLGADAGTDELIADVDRMRDIDREGYGAPA